MLHLEKQIRVIGFDDAPFDKGSNDPVNISGVVCSNTRFEGMVWGRVTRDGMDSTDEIIRMLLRSKFIQQIHVILFDGVAFAGFNVIDLARIHTELNLPCIAVMRREPDLVSIQKALSGFTDGATRWATIQSAGKWFTVEMSAPACTIVFQTKGIDVGDAKAVLRKVTDTGCVPEALRLAHMIGSAVKTGQSNNRA